MKSALAFAVLSAICLVSAASARADTVFDFSYSGDMGGNAFSGSGTITATDNGNGTFTAVSGSGTSTEAGNLTLEPAGNYNNTLAPTDVLSSDNILFPSGTPQLDTTGIVFEGTSPPLDPNSVFVNIYQNGSGYTYFNNYDSFPNGSTNDVTFSLNEVSATPLPATLPLFAAGLGLFGAFSRKKKKTPAV